MRYRHYKGGVYELVCEAVLEADHTPVMVYRGAVPRFALMSAPALP
jgi:hypothetical protein